MPSFGNSRIVSGRQGALYREALLEYMLAGAERTHAKLSPSRLHPSPQAALRHVRYFLRTLVWVERGRSGKIREKRPRGGGLRFCRLRGGKIRVLGTRILREVWDADFGGVVGVLGWLFER